MGPTLIIPAAQENLPGIKICMFPVLTGITALGKRAKIRYILLYSG